MSSPLPDPVAGWSLAGRIRWILRQPTNNDLVLKRLVTLVYDEKARSVELAATMNVCTFDTSDTSDA